tara:strand:- start:11 stop:487 length:477 start_codon:yes stop_codon:yes gene_type:complete
MSSGGQGSTSDFLVGFFKKMHPFTHGYIQGYHQGYSEAMVHNTNTWNKYSSEVDAFSQLLCDEAPIHVEDLHEDVDVKNNVISPHLELEAHPIKQTLTLSEQSIRTATKNYTTRFQCNKCCRTYASSDGVLKHYKKRHGTKAIIKNKIASYCFKRHSS